jgi:hypothetical protein
MITTPQQIARLVCREGMTNRSVTIIPNSNQDPQTIGEGFYYTTPSVKTRINHPSSYGWKMWYHHSTLQLTVGDKWINRVKKHLETPPKGMMWKKEPFGSIYLERITDRMDWHPAPKDLARKDFSTFTRKEMARHYNQRIATRKLERESKRLQAIMDKQIMSCYVTLDDSRRAGNCVEGSLLFAEKRLGLTRDEILAAPFITKVSAKRLLATNEPRARAAVIQAWKRETMVSI